MIKTLMLQSEAKSISFGIIYGLLGSKRGLVNSQNLMRDYLDGVSCLHGGKPVVIYVANDLYGYEPIKKAVEHQPESKGIQFIDDFSSQNSEAFLASIPRFPLSIIWGGRVPKAVFEKMVSLSHLPVTMEGSNTAELCQSLGKPYLPINMKSHPFSASPAMVEKNGYFAALLLGYPRKPIEREIKRMELVYQNAGEKTWQSLFDWNTYDDKSDDKSDDDLLGLCRQNIFKSNLLAAEDCHNLDFSLMFTEGMMLYGDSNLNTFICDLIPAFIAGQTITSLKELPTHTGEERFQLIMKLIKSRQLGKFHEYLKLQSATMLREFIKQSTDKNSEVSEHCQKLKLHVLAPENNTLVKALSQIPAETFLGSPCAE